MDALIQAALRKGGRDNVTAIVVDARNVAHDDGAGTTAPRLTSADGDEVTLPRPASEAVTQPLPEPVEETADQDTTAQHGEQGNDGR